MVRRATIVVADTVLTFLVFTPLHIIHWRGTWDIWDHYAQIDCRDTITNTSTTNATESDEECKEFAGNWLGAGLCCFICWLLNCVSPLMEDGAQKLGKGKYVLVSRLYMYLYAFVSLGQWRSVWNLVDEYTNTEWRPNLVGLGASLLVCLLTRTLRYGIPIPWDNKCDENGDRFRAGGWLQITHYESGWWKWCANLAMSQVVIVNLNIVLWRCYWNILDDAILPDQYDLSAGICLAVGAVTSFILVLISNFASKYSASLDQKHIIAKIAFEDFFNVIVLAATVMYWRGFWNLIEEHLLSSKQTGSKELGGCVCHVIGVVGLMVSLNFSGAYDNSVCLDGDKADGEGVKPDVKYLEILCKHRIQQSKVNTSDLASAAPEKQIKTISINGTKELGVLPQTNGAPDIII